MVHMRVGTVACGISVWKPSKVAVTEIGYLAAWVRLLLQDPAVSRGMAVGGSRWETEGRRDFERMD